MDNFQIETAQNISIYQNVASVGDRILAFIVDGFIIGLYAVISSLALAGTGLDGSGQWVYYVVMGLPSLLYYILWESLYNGQTPGKAALQIRVVKLDGSRPAFAEYLIRWLLRFIDITLSSGAIAVVSILLNGKGQRLGDLAAKTTVISEKPRTNIHRSLAVDVPENHQPKYPQVSVLKDTDVQNIKNLYQKAKRENNHQLILTLSEKVSALLETKPEESPMHFIQQVITDYNYYTQRA
jgi:uncharacterized RDD family membrane protein YckC